MDTLMMDELFTEEQEEIGYEKNYAVVMYNDDYTFAGFVILVLCSVFDKTMEDAMNLMMNIQREGKGTVGVYGLEEAYKKTDAVAAMNKQANQQLFVTVEEV